MRKIKKIIIINLIMLLIFVIAGCSNNNASNSTQNDNVKQESNKTKESGEQEKAKQEETEAKIINKGETIIVEDFCEFTIDDTKFAKKIIPPNPSDFYSYYEAKEPDTTYLDTIITIKSLLDSGKFPAEFASVKVVYNNKYEYTTFSIIEEGNGSDFTYTNITPIEPLKSGTLHFLAEVPDEVENGDDPVFVIVTINDQEYKYNVK